MGQRPVAFGLGQGPRLGMAALGTQQAHPHHRLDGVAEAFRFVGRGRYLIQPRLGFVQPAHADQGRGQPGSYRGPSQARSRLQQLAHAGPAQILPEDLVGLLVFTQHVQRSHRLCRGGQGGQERRELAHPFAAVHDVGQAEFRVQGIARQQATQPDQAARMPQLVWRLLRKVQRAARGLETFVEPAHPDRTPAGHHLGDAAFEGRPAVLRLPVDALRQRPGLQMAAVHRQRVGTQLDQQPLRAPDTQFPGPVDGGFDARHQAGLAVHQHPWIELIEQRQRFGL